MRLDINNYIDNYQSCADNHGSVKKLVPMQSYPVPSQPWETLAINLLKLPQTSEGHNLFVAIDHFSHFCILVPLKDKHATTVARALVDEVFCKFNTSKVLLSDNGTEFNNQVLEAICKEYDIQKTNMVAYHAASNGMVERSNRKIIQNLRTLVGDVSSTWHEWMSQVMASLNSSLHTTTGDTPHFVAFGVDKNLPYNILIQKEDPVYNFDDTVKLRTRDFQRIYKHVHSNITDSKISMNEQQRKGAREKLIVVGDIVYMKVHEPKNKLAPRFEGPYRVRATESGNKLKIKHLTTKETKIAHLDHLKRHTRLQSPADDEEDEQNPTPSVQPTSSTTADEATNEYRKKLRSYTGNKE